MKDGWTDIFVCDDDDQVPIKIGYSLVMYEALESGMCDIIKIRIKKQDYIEKWERKPAA